MATRMSIPLALRDVPVDVESRGNLFRAKSPLFESAVDAKTPDEALGLLRPAIIREWREDLDLID